MTIHEYNDPSDRVAVIALWNGVFGVQSGHNDPGSSIERKLMQKDGLFFVAVDHSIVGTVMCGYDGHRGWICSLAVAADQRRRGVGAALVRHAEQALASRGCAKVNLQIVSSNAEVIGFYEKLGYSVEPRVSMGKRLYA